MSDTVQGPGVLYTAHLGNASSGLIAFQGGLLSVGRRRAPPTTATYICYTTSATAIATAAAIASASATAMATATVAMHTITTCLPWVPASYGPT